MNDHQSDLEKAVAYVFKEYLLVGLLIFFIVFAAIVASDFSRDSVAYNRMFATYGASGWDAFANEVLQREVFILLISKAYYGIGLGAFFLFLTFATLSLTVKFFLIETHSRDRWLSLAFFGSYFLILHDSTQIRFGVAIAFVYLGLTFLADNKKLLFASIVIFSSVMFHAVSLVFILMLFFSTKKSLLWLFGMVAVAIVLYPFNNNDVLLSAVREAVNYFDVQGTILNKLYFYLSRSRPEIFLGMFSRSAMLVYLCAIVIYQYRDKFSAYEVLCYNAFIMSIFFYILLKDSVDIQVRVRDLFGFSLVFLMPFIHRGMSEYIGSRNAYIILYLYLGVHLIKFAIYDKMLIL